MWFYGDEMRRKWKNLIVDLIILQLYEAKNKNSHEK